MDAVNGGQRFFADKIIGREERDGGFFAVLRNDRNLGATFLQIINSVRRIPLTKKCFLGLGLDNLSAQAGVSEEGSRIEICYGSVFQMAPSSLRFSNTLADRPAKESEAMQAGATIVVFPSSLIRAKHYCAIQHTNV